MVFSAVKFIKNSDFSLVMNGCFCYCSKKIRGNEFHAG